MSLRFKVLFYAKYDWYDFLFTCYVRHWNISQLFFNNTINKQILRKNINDSVKDSGQVESMSYVKQYCDHLNGSSVLYHKNIVSTLRILLKNSEVMISQIYFY